MTSGDFFWLELQTTDGAAAKSFYGDLFGWANEDIPIGEDTVYTIFSLGGKTTAAGYGPR